MRLPWVLLASWMLICTAVSGAVGQLRSDVRAPFISATILVGQSPDIDGVLNDPVWTGVSDTLNFIQLVPQPGAVSTLPTGVQVLYDHDAIYIGIRLYDHSPDSVATRVTRRDAWSEATDWAHVYIDSYGDRRTAFRFSTNPSGVKVDALHFGDTQEDVGWDAVWDVGVHRDSLGWSAEYRIPLSQLRFASASDDMDQEWGVNFGRFVARYGERAYWAPIPGDAERFVSAFGRLTGVHGLSAPRRLEIQPYILSQLTRSAGADGNPFHRNSAGAATVGADIRYGLTSDFTLNLAVNPDFGQVEADPSVVNLSSFENFFPEKRPFFLEGTDIFGVTFPRWPPLVHSRRIGGRPRGQTPSNVRFVDRPDASRILVASKLTGKTAGGVSLGLMNAVTQRESARYLDDAGSIGVIPVEPQASYSVARVTKDFRDGQSAVGLIATATNRGAPSGFVGNAHSAAYVAGLDWRHRFGGGEYETSGSVVGSHVRGQPDVIAATQRAAGRRFQRPDAGHLDFDSTRTSLAGQQAGIRLAKIGGGHWRWQTNARYVSPGFEVNDLGFQNESDQLGVFAGLGYVQFEPMGPFRQWQVDVIHEAAWTLGGERRFHWAQMFGNAQLKNFWRVNFGIDRTFSAFSTEALRGGSSLREPGYLASWWGVSTDARKSAIFDLSGFAMRLDEKAGHRFNITPSVTVRPSARMDLSLATRLTWFATETQYVGGFPIDDDVEYVFGRLRQRTLSVTARLNYAFDPDLSLQVYAQPFSSRGRFDNFKIVTDPHALEFGDRFAALGSDLTVEGGGSRYSMDRDGDGVAEISFGNPNFDFKQIRSNVVLRWEFRPGSTIFAVWSQDRGSVLPTSPFDLGGTNVFLLKFSYWLAG